MLLLVLLVFLVLVAGGAVAAVVAVVAVARMRRRTREALTPEDPLGAMFRENREENERRRRDAVAAMPADDALREWVARGGGSPGWLGFDGSFVSFHEEPPPGLLGAVRAVQFSGDREPNLKRLPTPDCSFGIDLSQVPVSDRGLSALTEYPGLAALNLFNHLNVTDASLKIVGRMTDLVMLDLQVTEVTARGIEHLAGLSALRYLAVTIPGDFRRAVRPLRGMTQLAALVGGSDITDDDLRGLAPLSGLTHLALSSYVSNAGVPHLRAFPRLTFLKLASYQLTDDGLSALPALGALQQLELFTGDAGVRGSGLAALTGLPELRELRLATNALTGVGFEYFAALPRLKVIDLSNNPITDAGIARLKLPPQVDSVNLASTKLTDAGIARLELPASVTRLCLNSIRITDASIEHLARFTSLQGLGIMGTKLTLPGAHRLSEALPNCTIQTSFPK